MRNAGVETVESFWHFLDTFWSLGAWREGPAARFVVDGYPRSEEQLRGWQRELSNKVKFLCCISLEAMIFYRIIFIPNSRMLWVTISLCRG